MIVEILGGKNFTQFSAVCWLFGRYLYESLKYPIGLVESCWGGTPVEAWSSLRALQSCGLKEPESRSPVYTFPKSAMSNSLSYTDEYVYSLTIFSRLSFFCTWVKTNPQNVVWLQKEFIYTLCFVLHCIYKSTLKARYYRQNWVWYFFFFLSFFHRVMVKLHLYI